MARYTSGNNPPLGHWNSLPIYLTTILTGVFVVGFVVSAVLMSMHSSLLRLLIFTMPLEPPWSLWRLLSYVFINQVSFFTPFSIFFFYWMSLGIETHLGRPIVARLLTLLTLTVPVTAAVWWWLFHQSSNTFLNGDYMFFSGVLVAFATLYPKTEVWGWVPFKWVAFACIVCGSLMLLAANDWVALSQLWTSCAVGFGYIRHAVELEYDDYQSPFARLQTWFRRRKFRVVRPEGGAAARRSADPESASADEMDRLLDKIAKSGMASLTAKERSRLEKAREALLKREGR
ncbi:MAG: hypothetical protein QOE70_2240 [Chthoniobacter sp.]|jgi:hypothetical protein|nr:hypothetical protein [Chthoniobacter sp.]